MQVVEGQVNSETYIEMITHNAVWAKYQLQPITGKQHQLRVHLEHIGSPIMGDSLYGPGKLGQRMFLHATSLEITIPGSNENQRMTFEAPVPDDFEMTLENLR